MEQEQKGTCQLEGWHKAMDDRFSADSRNIYKYIRGISHELKRQDTRFKQVHKELIQIYLKPGIWN